MVENKTTAKKLEMERSDEEAPLVETTEAPDKQHPEEGASKTKTTQKTATLQIDTQAAAAPTTTTMTRGKILWLMGLFALQNSCAAVLGRYIQTHKGAKPFDLAHMLMATEVLKLLLSCVLESGIFGGSTSSTTPWQTLRQGLVLHLDFASWDSWQLAVPAVLYFMQNFLYHQAIALLPVPLFQVTTHCKVVLLAVLSTLFLQRRYTALQWVSVVSLTAGISIVSVWGKPSSQSSEDESSFATNTLYTGLAILWLSNLCSSTAAIYFERVIKKTAAANNDSSNKPQPSLWMRNIQLSLFSLPFAYLSKFLFHTSPELQGQSFFYGFTPAVWCQVVLFGVGGLLVAALIRSTSNVHKSFAMGVSVVLSTATSMVLFGTPLTGSFCLGTVIIIASVIGFAQGGNSQASSSSPNSSQFCCPCYPLVWLPPSSPSSPAPAASAACWPRLASPAAISPSNNTNKGGSPTALSPRKPRRTATGMVAVVVGVALLAMIHSLRLVRVMNVFDEMQYLPQTWFRDLEVVVVKPSVEKVLSAKQLNVVVDVVSVGRGREGLKAQQATIGQTTGAFSLGHFVAVNLDDEEPDGHAACMLRWSSLCPSTATAAPHAKDLCEHQQALQALVRLYPHDKALHDHNVVVLSNDAIWINVANLVSHMPQDEPYAEVVVLPHNNDHDGQNSHPFVLLLNRLALRNLRQPLDCTNQSEETKEEEEDSSVSFKDESSSRFERLACQKLQQGQPQQGDHSGGDRRLAHFSSLFEKGMSVSDVLLQHFAANAKPDDDDKRVCRMSTSDLWDHFLDEYPIAPDRSRPDPPTEAVQTEKNAAVCQAPLCYPLTPHQMHRQLQSTLMSGES